MPDTYRTLCCPPWWETLLYAGQKPQHALNAWKVIQKQQPKLLVWVIALHSVLTRLTLPEAYPLVETDRQGTVRMCSPISQKMAFISCMSAQGITMSYHPVIIQFRIKGGSFLDLMTQWEALPDSFVWPCPPCSKKPSVPCQQILLSHCGICYQTLLNCWFISIKKIATSFSWEKCITLSITGTHK